MVGPVFHVGVLDEECLINNQLCTYTGLVNNVTYIYWNVFY